MTNPRVTVDQALGEIASGRMLLVADRRRDGGGRQLVMAAQLATADHINFMTTHGKGLICLALTPERCEELELETPADAGSDERATSFTLSLDAREVLTHGVESSARARTIQRVLQSQTQPEDLVQPGHVFALKANPSGVLERPAHTEAAVDLARLAGLYPAGVICEVIDREGTAARWPDLEAFCSQHGLKLITLADVVAHRRRHDRLIERVAEAWLPTRFGDFQIVGYRSLVDDNRHVAMVKGPVAGLDEVPVHLHVECLVGDVFHSLACDCAAQLEQALTRIEEAGRGVVIYLARDRALNCLHDCSAGRGSLRDLGIGAQILTELEVQSAGRLTTQRGDVEDPIAEPFLQALAS